MHSQFPSWLALKLLLFTILTTFSISNAFGRSPDDDKKRVVCSTTQVADFARQIVGDRWEVVCLLGPAQDPHTHEPTAADSRAVASADLVAENGWNLEGHDWMKKLATAEGKPIVTCVTGIEPLQMEDEGQAIRDPHAWFDPGNARIYVNNLCEAFCRTDPEHEVEYRLRTELYTRQLALLDGWIKKTVNQIPANRRLLVTHHDAFGYFCKAYNFEAISPVGWTTGELSEVTPSQQQTVVKKIRETGVKAIFVETSVNEQLIENISREAGVEIGGNLYSDAMGADGTAGESYIGMLRENVLTIVRALK